VSAGEFLDLEHAGVAAEAEQRGVPHMVLTLDALCAEDVASAIALWQWAAVYGGLLREVNPFDQPAVEGSKKATVEMFEGFGPETRSRLERYTRDASQIL
jgi:glucose-6-phosphate isomerase